MTECYCRKIKGITRRVDANILTVTFTDDSQVMIDNMGMRQLCGVFNGNPIDKIIIFYIDDSGLLPVIGRWIPYSEWLEMGRKPLEIGETIDVEFEEELEETGGLF